LSHPTASRIHTLSLHAALPIFPALIGADAHSRQALGAFKGFKQLVLDKLFTHPAAVILNVHFRKTAIETDGDMDFALFLGGIFGDRKSTRLNSSHVKTSYAVFC